MTSSFLKKIPLNPIEKNVLPESILAGKVADMWATCRPDSQNVGTFGRHPPVVATQNQSRHSIFMLGIADIHPICIQVPELHTQNSSVRFVRNIWLLYPFRCYFLAPLNA
jgi:hypothetical protein